MVKMSSSRPSGRGFTGLALMLAIAVLSWHVPAVEGAAPVVPARATDGSSNARAHGGGVTRALGTARIASRHILVQLHPRTDEKQFLRDASAQGLRRLSRVYGTRWLRMAIPSGAAPAQAAAAARTLPGVLRATLDPLVTINDQIPPRDPIYQNDDDPTTKPCDPFVEICDPWTLVDQWGLFKAEAETGWMVQRGSPNIVIAILDSGVDLDHDDLWAKLWTNPGEIPGNEIDDDGNGLIDDVHGANFAGSNVGGLSDDPALQDGNPDIPMGGGWVMDPTAFFGIRFVGNSAAGDGDDNNHDGLIDIGVTHGTLVAGIAGALTDNVNPQTLQFEGMAGACWHCKLMPVRLINAEGWAFGSDAASAIYYAASMGAHVINISWGMDLSAASPSELQAIQVIADAIDFAVSRGVIVVAAAGNSGRAGLHFPAIMNNTIAVGSADWLDRRSWFSSHAVPAEIPDNGLDDDGNGWVDDVLDVVAPGELIWSTMVLSAYDALLYELLGLPGLEPGLDTYGGGDGTSFATPLVSGYVGLLLSQNPDATLGQVRQVLRSNARDVLDPQSVGASLVGYDAYSGFGRLRMVVPTLAPETNAPPTAYAGSDQTVAVKGKATTATVTLDASGSYDPDGTLVSYQWLEDGTPIATGQRVSVNLGMGSHTITLRVTDDDQASNEDQVTIEVGKRGGSGGGKK
jgi:subtilisin family serine protease